MSYMKIKQNPFLLFLPFLIFYFVIILCYPTNGNFGDESRYIIYAKYMLHGSLPAEHSNFDILGNGPGYSMLLLPLVALGLPLICLTLLNGILYYLSIVLLFKTLQIITTFKRALAACLFWAFYINLYEYIVKILPETLVAFLISLLAFSITKAFLSSGSKKYILISGIVIGYLALTKPIFGYVLLVILFVIAVFWILKRNSRHYQRALVISLIAMAAISPYLTYTYVLTGKVFYLSSFGGTSLYWMTSPYEKEYGSWFPDVLPNSTSIRIDSGSKKYLISNYEEYLKKGHQKNFEEIDRYTSVQRDEAYRRIAFENIKKYPAKFLSNCLSNVGRIFFNFPYSYKVQTPYTLIRLPFNGLILICMLLSFIPAIKNWRKIKFPLRFLILFVLIYLGGSVLGSAETRMFTVIVPILIIWIAYLFQKIIRINWGKWENSGADL